MRADWNERAREDAHYYAAFGRRDQDDAEFFAAAADLIRNLESELRRFPAATPPSSTRRALEIGCGPGRLMRPMSRHFGEIHGVDVSDEMIAQARRNLRRHSARPPAPHQRQRPLALPRQPFRFRLLLRRLPAHPERGRCLLLSARNRTRPEARRIRAPPARWPPPPAAARTPPGKAHASAPTRSAPSRAGTASACSRSPASTRNTCGPPGRKPLPCRDPPCGERVQPGAGRPRHRTHRLRHAADRKSSAKPATSTRSKPLSMAFPAHLATSDRRVNGLSQFNVFLPEGVRKGLVPVRLEWHGERLCPDAIVRVIPPGPAVPRLVSVSDGVNLISSQRIESRLMKAILEEVESIDDFAATIDGAASARIGNPEDRPAGVALRSKLRICPTTFRRRTRSRNPHAQKDADENGN